MASQEIDFAGIWDDEPGEPCPLTPEELEARIEAAKAQMEREVAELALRNQELALQLTHKEAELQRMLSQFSSAVAQMETELQDITASPANPA